MTIPAGATCCAIPRGGFHYGRHRCGKPAKHEHKGRFFCGIHNPIQLEARRAKHEARWQEQREASDLSLRRATHQYRVINTAKAAVRQEGSWDAVAAAVQELEDIERQIAEREAKAL